MDTPASPLLSEHDGDAVHREDQLRTTLHCDDKEKLRRKLALLQREYLRTAERLQRAERLDAVRSRISQQDQGDPEVTSNPRLISPSALILDATDGTAPSVEVTGGPADSDHSRRSQVIRFPLPSEAACSQTLDPSHGAAGGYRPSPGLRLRSRRSRLRWERRSAEAGRSTDDNSEEGREQSKRMETVGAEESEERVETEAVKESEELFSGTDSESPSLLLTHWNTCGKTEMGRKIQERKQKETELTADGEKESESTSVLLTCCNAVLHTEDGAKNGRGNETEGGDNSRGQRDGRILEDGSNKDSEQNAQEEIQSENIHDHTAEIKEEKSEMVVEKHDVKSVSLLDSCTLVEGLLFPAEYYVRTTRRMTFSQSQPDMQAVILSQLSMGRRRRSRGGRGPNRLTHNDERSDQHTHSGSLTSVSPSMESQPAGVSAELNSQSSGETLDRISACQIATDSCFSPTVAAARPARGRRKRRGRGRGRPRIPRCPPSLDPHQLGLGQTSDGPQPTGSLVPSSLSLHGADGPKPCLSPGETVPVQDDPLPASTHRPATQPSPGVNGAQSSSTSGHPVNFFPIFVKSSNNTNGSTQMSRSAASWRSLLLPSSPATQTSLLPLPSPSSGSLVNKILNFDIPQDFHLPDDQFASLKLHKLRQVAMDSGVEHFTSPSYNTRRSSRCFDPRCSSSEAATPLLLPLSLTPTISNSPHPTKAAATQSVHKLVDKLAPARDITEIRGEQQTENLHPECKVHTTSTESVSVVQDCAADRVDGYVERETVILNSHGQSSVSASSTHSPVKPQPHVNFTNRPAGKVDDLVIRHSEELQIKESPVISSEEQADCPSEDQRSTSHQIEDRSLTQTRSFDFPLQKTREEPSNSCTAVQLCNDSEAPGASPVRHLHVKSPATDSKESSEPTTSPARDGLVENQNHVHRKSHSQLLLSPRLASAPCPFTTPHLPSSALLSSPALPSLGLSPHLVPAALPLTSSSSAPALTLPPPHSPSIQVLSPPPLSPCPSLPLSQPTPAPAGQIQASSELLCTEDQSQTAAPPKCPTPCGGPVDTAEEHVMRCTHTLKAPAGGCLVDACCLPGSSGGLCVAAAGAWAVCLWSQTSASDWSLTHTWAFDEPVINVFPVPDAAGLMCVTLGQLEIREVRMLSCCSLLQVLLCEGVVQAVVGVSKSRVVASVQSASGSILQVFTLSDSGSTSSSLPLVSPGVCVGDLAPVDGLSDALIGSDEGGRLFVWNLKSGQLLRRIILGDGLSHMAVLRGYSCCGVLFVLLQHRLLSSLEEEAKEKEEERKTAALFSLVAVNPLSGKSALATRLYPPRSWSGRLCEADVDGSSVVGLSQRGCVCVWELGLRGAPRTVAAPETGGWQLARWGHGGTLVVGHHNGDVTLHRYSVGQTSH